MKRVKIFKYILEIDAFIIDPVYKEIANNDMERKCFWTDVLISFELSIETIFSEARKYNNE